MRDDPIRREARLLAVEYLVSHVYNLVLKMTSASEEVIRQAEDSGLHAIGLQKIAGKDPAMSDHASAEMRDAIADLLNGAREMRAKG